MTSKTHPAGTPVATGIASGSLGTGTAVDDETTLMTVPDPPESSEQRGAASLAPAATPAPAAEVEAPATTPSAAAAVPPRATSRRDPYRPIGIALAAILVALAGVAVVSSAGEAPAQIGPLPGATTTPDDAAAGDEDDEDDSGNGGNNGNGRGNGNGNGNGGDNGRGNDD